MGTMPVIRFWSANMNVATAASAAVLALIASADAQSIVPLDGALPGYPRSYARAVSADGGTVVGHCYSPSLDRNRAAIWRQSTGWQALPDLAGAADAYAFALSDDGSVVAGYCWVSGRFRACLWNADRQPMDLGDLPGFNNAFARSVSADGSVIAGYCSSFPGTGLATAFRWTATQGMMNLGSLPGATSSIGLAVSRDGLTIVGNSNAGSAQSERAFCWREATGMFSLTDAASSPSFATCVSADGSCIAGYLSPISNSGRFFRWTASAGFEDLGTGGAAFAYCFAMDHSGNTMVGHGYADSVYRGMVWRRSLGLVRLDAYLSAAGVDLNPWTIVGGANGCSATGRFIVGSGSYAGQDTAYRIDLGVDADGDAILDALDNCPAIYNPTQADCDNDGIGDACDPGEDYNGNVIPDYCECIADLYVDGVVNGVDLGALLAYWGPTTSSAASQRADLNRDGAVDGIDLGYQLSRWGPCTN